MTTPGITSKRSSGATDETPTPVGVTIAIRRLRKQEEGEKTPAVTTTTPTTTEEEPVFSNFPPRRSSSASLQQLASNRRRRRRHSSIRRKAAKITKPVSSWVVFSESATLYAACLVLPALLGSLVRFSQDHWAPLLSIFVSRYSNTQSSLEIPTIGPETRPNDPIWSSNTNTHDDVWTVALFALGLAFLRLGIVQWIVMPLQSSHQLHAMVRCKSINLLSSDYSQTPEEGTTPAQNRPTRIIEGVENIPPLPSLWLVPEQATFISNIEDDDEDYSLGLRLDESEQEAHDPLVLRPSLQPTEEHPQHEHLLQEDDPSDDDEHYVPLLHDEDLSDDEDDADIMQELADRLTAVATAAETITPNRLYAGPRYATAWFHLLYTTAASGLALYSFKDANFWPWYTGGTGSTQNCWDLSGGLTVSGLDADFDHHNAVLKRYFLWQASYHWHSGAFHMLSMLMLLLHPQTGTNSPTRFWALRTNTSAYVRSLTQHCLALGSIAVSYVFSSLRRLAAIAMFAFDVSSWFLHFLQVVINAPPDSILQYIPAAALHKYVVVPVFLVCRAGIWPALAYSALTESDRWLQQLERTLWPGAARQIIIVLAVWHALVLASTAVYGRRLWYHQHVRRVSSQQEVS
jgi:hypothetical protein